ncbi:MAG: ABC transporter ATP-binding protein [Candidatus Eremiobacteraeota bacterium]|nr:ABC transporter ATP-binding protein [Candidatus Eremiobacteraeota bacterium]
MPPQRRPVSLLPAGGAVFPHLSAFQNLAFPLRVNGTHGAAISSQVNPVAAALHLGEQLAINARLLSAGEQQRVALGRALLRSPRLLLLDEPVAHLDPPLRESVRKSIVETARERGISMVYVTHDHEDAFAVADRIAVMIAGRIVQVDTPQAVYDNPLSVDVARFVGPVPMNIVPRKTEIVGIRAEHITIVDEDADVRGSVVRAGRVGASRLLHVQTEAGGVRVVAPERDAIAIGSSVGLKFAAEHIRRFDVDSGLAK